MSSTVLPFGIMHQQWAEQSVSDAEQMRGTLEDIVLAEELGFASFMLGEHHFQSDALFSGRVPTPELVLAQAAGSTGRILLGTGVKVLALDPVWRTVESMLTLDLLTGGRTFYGLGAGGDEPDIFLPRVLDADGRRGLFRDCLLELLELLRTQGRSMFGKPLSPAVDSATVIDRLMVAARDVPTITLAAEQALMLVVGQVEPAVTQSAYARTFRAAGGRRDIRAVRIVILGPDDETALQIARPAYELYSAQFVEQRYYVEQVSKLYATPYPTSYLDGLARMGFLVGGPESIADQLASEQRVIGADRLDIMVNVPALPARARRESMRLLATEVAPRLREATLAVAS